MSENRISIEISADDITAVNDAVQINCYKTQSVFDCF